jgi:hypothetical protein
MLVRLVSVIKAYFITAVDTIGYISLADDSILSRVLREAFII